MDQFAHDLLAQQSGTTAAWIGGISLAIFIIVKIKKAFAAIWPFIKKLIAVVEDLFGAEARPGVVARPGLMARMQKSEENDVAITTVLEAHSETLLELKPNHGGSMKDVLNASLLAITEQGLAIAEQGLVIKEQCERTDRLEQSLITHISEQRAAVTNAEASALDAAIGVTNAERSAKSAAIGVTNAEASAVNAATAATNAATAATGAAAAVVGAEAAVVGARAAVVSAEAAVSAATKDRADRQEIHVNVTPNP